jgi:xanthine phosphoribosyltransferase
LKQYYSYDHFRDDITTLVKEVTPFQAEAVIAVARGGLCMAHCMAEGLGLREVQTIRTELYDNRSKRKEITIFDHCSLCEVQRVLVVDDIADSGETLQKVMEYLKGKYPNIEFQSATLFYKQTSVYKPHYWVQEANAWIEFFWEKDFHH